MRLKVIRFFKSAVLKNSLLNEAIRIRGRKRRAYSYYMPSFKLINSWAKKNSELSNYYYDLNEKNQADLASLISAITQTSITKVEEFFNEIQNNEKLRAHISSSWAGDPSMADAKLGYGRRIGWYAFIRILKPKVIIETGVHHGVGSCVIATALIKNLEEGYPGRYFGTDIDKNAGMLFVNEFAEVGTILFGDSIYSLKLIENQIDVFINDSDHSADYEMQEYETIKSLLSTNALILGDNSHVTDSLRKFSQINQRKFIFFREVPKDHWYPGAGIGISFKTL